MIEHFLINHCAPTLAGLKMANLFCFYYSNEIELNEQLEKMNNLLNPKGLYFKILRKKCNNAMILAYRKKLMEEELSKNSVIYFLESYGYENNSIDYCLDKLSSRILLTNDFPHEIGVFIGYPLEDVKSFIKNRGKNYKCIGCWKVYHNENEAIYKFNKFKKCQKIYSELFYIGRSIEKLTIAV